MPAVRGPLEAAVWGQPATRHVDYTKGTAGMSSSDLYTTGPRRLLAHARAVQRPTEAMEEGLARGRASSGSYRT